MCAPPSPLWAAVHACIICGACEQTSGVGLGHYSRIDGRTLLIAVLAELVWAHTPEYPDEAPLVRARRCQATSHPPCVPLCLPPTIKPS